MESERLLDIRRFYEAMSILEEKIDGTRILSECDGYMNWPDRGVYFFMETGEIRSNADTARIVRVGTHALNFGKKTTLWSRLKAHQGTVSTGGGNHRESVFRKHIGYALIEKYGLFYEKWGVGSSAPRSIRDSEFPLEKMVSDIVRHMPFLYLAIDDESGPDSLRGYIERNSIELLSNYGKTPTTDPPSDDWLGNWHPRKEIWILDYGMYIMLIVLTILCFLTNLKSL